MQVIVEQAETGSIEIPCSVICVPPMRTVSQWSGRIAGVIRQVARFERR
jgi:hypothetical protein